MFLGYPIGTKGYKLLDVENDKGFVSRNIVFHEWIMPYRKKKIIGEMNQVIPRLERNGAHSLTVETGSKVR